jgi:hypothetical protein
MRLDPILTDLEAAVSVQIGAAGADPVVEAAAGQLLAALRPALRAAGLALAEQAAAEVGAQLGDRRVDVVLEGGEPALRVTEVGPAAASAADEDFLARITLRLPPSVKALVEEAAEDAGDSVNQWVVNALSARARRTGRVGSRVSGSFDL